jgi:membrane associated rhomboid family serine protease
MFFPVGIDHVIKRLPVVTIAIIALCTAVQIFSNVWAPSKEEIENEAMELILQREANPHDNPFDDDEFRQQLVDLENKVQKIPIVRFGYKVGFERLPTADRDGSSWNANLLLSTFVHAGWLHLIGNMLFLWLTGAALEDRFGRARFAALYVTGAIAATFTFAHLHGDQPAVLVGASGAISALMGAFLVCFTRTQIFTAYWLGWRAGILKVAAYVALPLWFAEQLFQEWMASKGPITPVAYGAHIGGFLFGVVVALAGRAYARVRPQAIEASAADGEAALPRAVATQLSKQLPKPELDRFTQCMAAIHRGDQAASRLAASRVLLDLARVGDRARILQLLDAIAANLPSLPLTDRAFAVAAEAVDEAGETDRYIAIATALDREHPYSAHVPKVLWRLAELHREAGRADLATQTLQGLARRFPRDEHGKRAAQSLAG